MRELGAALEDAATDDAVRVLVLRGEGPMFSSGMDLADLRHLSENPDSLRAFRRPLIGWWNLLEEMPKPTICQIHGAALGGAFELALACDFRTMAEDAVAGIMEVRIGLLPDVGGCSRLPAVVGLGNAKELILTGKVIDGKEAHRIGFANRIAPADSLDELTGKFAEELLACAPRAVGLAKRVLDAAAKPALLSNARAGGLRPGAARRKRGLRRGRARLLREAPAPVRAAAKNRACSILRPDPVQHPRATPTPETTRARSGVRARVRIMPRLGRGNPYVPKTGLGGYLG